MSVGAPQQILSGKYRLERELGRGGMGSVWLAQHLTLRSPVAIKLIDPQIASNPEALARFLREAQAAAALRSPHVVQILDHGVDEGVPFIVMELLEGESLAARLERQQRLTPEETARIITQVARAMTRAHEAGVVHRDLKPDNIFLVRNDEEEVAKVLDFGVAKSHLHGMGAAAGATRTGSVLGTPYYMSPEQAEGAKSLDHRTDIWAMGVIAYECLLGAKPFESDTLGGLLLAICARDMPVPSRASRAPAGFDHWFARACSRDQNLRFASAKQAAQELRAICGAPEAQAIAAGPHSGRAAVQASSLPLASTTGHLGLSASRETAKRSAPAIVLALLGMAVVGGGVFFALRGQGTDPIAASSASAPAELPKAAAPPVAPPEPPKSAPTADAPTAQAPSAAPIASSAPVPVTRAPVRPGVTRKSSSTEKKPAAAPAVEPAPAAAAAAPAPQPAPAATPAARPRVNLGI
jgi:eukaryotic-like serine/threonine-protein kinase